MTKANAKIALGPHGDTPLNSFGFEPYHADGAYRFEVGGRFFALAYDPNSLSLCLYHRLPGYSGGDQFALLNFKDAV